MLSAPKPGQSRGQKKHRNISEAP
jgi:hypothetical protein